MVLEEGVGFCEVAELPEALVGDTLAKWANGGPGGGEHTASMLSGCDGVDAGINLGHSIKDKCASLWFQEWEREESQGIHGAGDGRCLTVI